MDELMKPEPTWLARLETLRGRLAKGPGYLPVLAAAFTRVRRVGHTAAALEVARRIGAVFVVADELAAADTRLRAAPGVRVVSLIRADSTLRGLSRPIVIDHFAMEKVIGRALEIGRDAFAALELSRGLEAQNDQLRHELLMRAGELAEAKARQEMAEQAACGWAMDCGRLEAGCASTPLAATLYEAVRWVLNRAQTDPEFRWHMHGTETFERLISAEAEHTGRSVADVSAQRVKDLQPEYRRRRAECAMNRERVRDLELLLEERGIEVPCRAQTYVPPPVREQEKKR